MSLIYLRQGPAWWCCMGWADRDVSVLLVLWFARHSAKASCCSGGARFTLVANHLGVSLATRIASSWKTGL